MHLWKIRCVLLDKLKLQPRAIILLSCMIIFTFTYFALFDYWYQKSDFIVIIVPEKNQILPKEWCENVVSIYKHILKPGNRVKIKNVTKKEEILEDFQAITNVSEKLYMYSAYYDDDIKSVKLIGGAKMASLFQFHSTQVYCQFYDESKRLVSSCVGFIQNVELMSDNKPYGASFIICSLQPIDCQIPTYISISVNTPNLGLPKNLFHINYNSLIKTPSVEFSVCVQPIFSYEAPLQFLEWIEFYKLMGVQKFTFYNESIGPITSCIMNQYQVKNEVEVLKWSPVFIPNVEVHVHSQAVQINDCMYRNRGRSRFVVNVDLDEMIMPSTSSNYKEMLHQIHKVNRNSNHLQNVSAFVFSNGFFYLKNDISSASHAKDLKDIQEALINSESESESSLQNYIRTKLIMSSNILREKDLNVPYERSKYIAVPNLVVKAGVHYLIESRSGSDMYIVPPQIAYVHHYRRTDSKANVMHDIKNTKRIIDNTALKFVEQLSINISRKLKEFGRECKIL